MPRHGVAAEERERVVGQRPDDGDPGRLRQRQRLPAVGEQHHRLLGQPPGDVPLRGRVEVQVLVLGPPGRLVAGRERRPAAVEQAELELLPEHPGGRAVDQLLGDVARGDRRQQRVAEAAGARQLHVKPGRERQRGRAGLVRRDPVLELDEGDREVVGYDHAVEAELVAEQGGEQVRVGAGGHAVAVDVGRHHRPGAADPDRHLERGQDDVGELARAHRDRRVVPAGPRRGVPGEVLERRLQAGRLQPLHVGGADRADQVRVLADGLLDPAPPVVAGHVEDRREPLVDAGRPHGRAERGRHLADEVRVEGRAPGQRRRVDRGAPGGEPGQALLVRDRRDAEPAAGRDPRLQPGQRPNPGADRHRAAAEHPGELAQPVLDELVERRLLLAELVLHRGHAVPVAGRALPDAAKLRDLLRQRHPAQQLGHPLVGRQRRVAPGFRLAFR